jgi:hypothetical protein
MPKTKQLQTTFGRGELDPLLALRTDVNAYFQGAEKVRNLALIPQGGLRRRPGTQYLANHGTPNVRLADFIFSNNQLYLFAFGNAELKVYDALGVLLTTVGGCPWTTAMLPDLYWTQAVDTMIVTHPDMPEQRILRTGASSFTVSQVAYEPGLAANVIRMPRYKHADDTVTLKPSATTGASINLDTNVNYWVAAHVGKLVWYKGKQLTVLTFVSATRVTARVDETLPATTADPDWEEQAFSSIYGYPVTCMFVDRRLVFFGSRDVPDGYWASRTNGFFNFDPGTGLDAEAIAETIGADKLNEARGMATGSHPLLFTDSSEFYVPTTESKPLTPANVSFKPQTEFGSEKIRPRTLDDAVMFVQKDSNTVREFIFADSILRYTADSVSLLSGHLLNTPKDLQVVRGGRDQPDYFAVVLNSDGTLAQFVSLRAESIAGWALWSTAGTVVACCAVQQYLFAVVTRVIAGATVHWLERFEWDKTWSLDAATKLTAGTPQTLWTGLTRFANQQVHVVSGGFYLGRYIVTAGGQLTVSDAVTEIIVGLDFTVQGKTMPLDGQLGDGPITGDQKRIIRAVVRLKDTLSFKIGGQRLLVRQVTDDLSQPPAYANGLHEFWFLGWDKVAQLEFTQDEPLPLTVQGLLVELET